MSFSDLRDSPAHRLPTTAYQRYAGSLFCCALPYTYLLPLTPHPTHHSLLTDRPDLRGQPDTIGKLAIGWSGTGIEVETGCGLELVVTKLGPESRLVQLQEF